MIFDAKAERAKAQQEAEAERARLLELLRASVALALAELAA
jgi:hypothetical protein